MPWLAPIGALAVPSSCVAAGVEERVVLLPAQALADPQAVRKMPTARTLNLAAYHGWEPSAREQGLARADARCSLVRDKLLSHLKSYGAPRQPRKLGLADVRAAGWPAAAAHGPWYRAPPTS